MANLTVTYEELRGAADQLASGRADIDDRLGTLTSTIDTLVSGGYNTSASSGAFHDTYAAFTLAARQTVATLDTLATYLRTAANSLQETDEALASQVRA